MLIIITLEKSEIDYDVAMTTHVVTNRELAAGASLEQGWNYSNTQDESGEVNIITRYEENAIVELTALLSRYLKDKEYESTNDLPVFTDAVFYLEMPDNYDMALTAPLRSAMHDFVVNRVIYDWYLKAKPDEAVIYEKQYNDAYDRVKSLLNKRVGLSKIKPWPAI